MCGFPAATECQLDESNVVTVKREVHLRTLNKVETDFVL